jgi:hypothetical protein
MQNIPLRDLCQLPIFSEPNAMSAIAMGPFYFARIRTDGRIEEDRRVREEAKKHRKPWIHLAAGDPGVAQRLKDWLTRYPIEVLNVAGPRASKEPGIASFVIL